MMSEQLLDEKREWVLLEAERWMELGKLERDLSNYSKAVVGLQNALRLFRSVSDRNGESKALGNLGNVFRDQGKLEQTIDYYHQALAISREIGNQRDVGLALGNIGNLYLAAGNTGIAISHLRESIEILQDIGDHRGLGVHLGNLSNAYRMMGQHEQASLVGSQAVAIVRKVGDRLQEGILVGNLGQTWLEFDRLDEAEKHFRQAIDICDETIPAAAGAFRGSLAHLLALQGQMDEAMSLLENGEQQVQSRPEEYAKFLCNKSLVCHIDADPEGFRTALVQAQEIAVELELSDDSEVGQAIAKLVPLLAGRIKEESP